LRMLNARFYRRNRGTNLLAALNLRFRNRASSPSFLSRHWSVFPVPLLFAKNAPNNTSDRIVELVDYTFLQRNDRVIGDVDILGADFGAALGDVAESHSAFFFQILQTIGRILRMHLQTG